MSTSIYELLPTALDGLSKLGPVLVGAYVAWIGRQQFATARQKLRLDLYDRRFSIYADTLDWYQALLSRPMPREELRSIQQRFIRSVRESRFLFGPESEVVGLLDEMNSRSFRILQFRDMRHDAKPDPATYAQQVNQQNSDIAWFGSAAGMTAIEKAMLPFLDFRNAGGLSLSRRPLRLQTTFDNDLQ